MLEIAKETLKDFSDDECPTRAAALAYYTIFALPPLLVLLIMLIGLVTDTRTIQSAIEGQFTEMIGAEAAAQVRTMIENANRPGGGNVLAAVIGFAGLLFGATGAVGQLQGALNRAWEVTPDPEKGGVKRFIVKRIFSAGMILAIAFLLLVSLVVSAALTAFGDFLTAALGSGSAALIQVLNVVASLAVVSLLFALLFAILPDAKVAWRYAVAGGAATAVLFVIGKFAIGFYLGQSEPGQAFGAAGALAVLLVWIYYAGLIVLLGAEFTQTLSRRSGGLIEPEEGAVRVVEEQRRV